MTPEQLSAKLTQIADYAQSKLPRIAGQLAENWVKGNFDREAYEGKKWKPRKHRNRKGRADTKLLHNIGNLDESVIGFPNADTDGNLTWGLVTDVPYAQVHNEGGQINRAARSELFTRNRTDKGRYAPGTQAGRGQTYRASTSRMPKRQFMPAPGEPMPESLEKEVAARIETDLTKICQ